MVIEVFCYNSGGLYTEDALYTQNCNMVGLSSAEDRAAAQTFYEDMGTLALEKK